MKKLLPIILICFSLQLKAQWSGAIIDSLTINQSRDEVSQQCIDIDKLNTLHVVYTRAYPSGGWGVYYKKRDMNSTWSAEDTVSGGISYHPVISASTIPGEAYIAYEGTATQGEEIFVCSNSGGTWNCNQITTDTSGNFSPTIDIDSFGYVHLAWIGVDSIGDYKIRYATNKSGSWVIQTLFNSQIGAFGSGAAPEIAVEKNGIAHIVYRGDNGTVYRIHHAYNSAPGSTNWNFDIVTTPNDEDLSSSIEVDTLNTVHLLVSGDDGFGFPVRAYYQTKTNSAFTFSTPTDVAPSYSASVGDLFVDNACIPHFVLNEISGNIFTGNIIYADSNNWAGMTLLNTADIYEGNLVMDNQHHAYLAAYRGNTYPDEEIIVYGYQIIAGVKTIDKNNIPYRVMNADDNLNIIFKENYSGRISCSGIDGKIVFDQTGNFQIGEIVPMKNPATGIYIFSIENNSGKFIQKIVNN